MSGDTDFPSFHQSISGWL